MNRDKLVKAVKMSALVGSLTEGAVAVIERKGPPEVIKDMGCGAVTGAVGQTASMIYKDKVNQKGIGSLLVGSVVSVATRYGYRGLFGTKPEEEEE